MINVVQIEVNSERLRLAEDGLNSLAEIIGGLMKMAGTGELPEEIEEGAARTAEEYCRIGAAACHIMADAIETLERREQE